MYYLIFYIILLPLCIGIAATIIYTTGQNRKAKNSVYGRHPALLFHLVTDTFSLDQSHITCKKFRSFIQTLQQKEYKTLTVSEAALTGQDNTGAQVKTVVLVFDDGFENFYTTVFPLLSEYTIKTTIFPVVGCIGTYFSWDIYRPKKHLSRDQLIKLSEAGHEIGSHTMTHPDCVLLSDAAVRTELIDSRKILEDVIQKPVHSLSFPLGSWNKRIWDIALECGYTAGVIYRNHAAALPQMIPVTGVYAFDTVQDLVDKIEINAHFSPVSAIAAAMSHFAKGTPVWKFRNSYTIYNYFRQ